jgi:hypothetical protein
VFDWVLDNMPWLAQNGPAQGISETCESTNAADAKLSVWEYGLYTNSDGKRYDLKNPGFEPSKQQIINKRKKSKFLV